MNNTYVIYKDSNLAKVKRLKLFTNKLINLLSNLNFSNIYLNLLELDNVFDKHEGVLFIKEKDNPLREIESKEEFINSVTNNSGLIKINKMEKFNYKLTEEIANEITNTLLIDKFNLLGFTIHGFLGNKDSVSFDIHTDPMKVIMVMLSGTKLISIYNEDNSLVEDIILNENDVLIMDENIKHKATYLDNSFMLSIGIEESYFGDN